MTLQIINLGSTPNDGTGDPLRTAFDKVNDNFTELYSALTGLLELKSDTDCSANPNYPSASKGDAYYVSVAGKIGGASGKSVEVGDLYVAKADNAGGNEATVGTSWFVLEHNLVGALVAANNLSDVPNPATARSNLGATTVGNALFTLTNPSAVRFLRVNADNSVSELDAATFRAAIGAGTGTGTGDLLAANNLSDVANPATALSNLGVTAAIAAAVAGLSWKQAVRVATTANGTLASAFENGDTVDGVTLVTGDRILIKNQSSGSENGIYTVNASGAPTRATDADSGAELVNASVYVSEGTTNADTQWTCTTNATITVGSTSLAFAQLTSGGYSPGGPDVAVVDGGTGSSTASGARTNLGLDKKQFIIFLENTALLASEILASLSPPSGETWAFPANLSTSTGKKTSGGTNPVSTYAIDVKKNGSSVGTISISTSGVVTFATSGGAAFSMIGGTDTLQFVGSATPDTAVGYAFNIGCTY